MKFLTYRSFHDQEKDRVLSWFRELDPTIKRLIIMRLNLFTLLLCISIVNVSASVLAQGITLKYKNASIEEVFTAIKKQSGFQFLYTKKMLNDAKKVSIEIKAKSLQQTLDQLFKEQPFTYEIIDKTIVVKEKRVSIDRDQQQTNIDVRGLVVDQDFKPLIGATVKVEGTSKKTATNNLGEYFLSDVANNAVLTVSYIGYLTQEVNVKNASKIILSKSESKLDEVQVIAYGTTTKRLNTGSVGSISAAEIAKQPASNILETLTGRIPGLVISQSSGTPGSSFSMQIRGRNSIAQGSEPLILIDGIPFATGNQNINTAISSIGNRNEGGGLSPFNSINPADIESIDVLKDADATAIYGSRGANGVILITTRRGKIGKTEITANIIQGITHADKHMKLLNTEQYLTMRMEAFKNSNITPTVASAPDLLSWDQNRYADLQKEFLGNNGHTTNAQLSISGGNRDLQFLLGGGYYRETSVFPDNLPNKRGSMNVNLNHTSTNLKFQISFSGSYTATVNNATGEDLTYYTFLPPNIPSFFDKEGNLNWIDGFENPYRYTFNKYKANTGNLMSSLNLSYKITPSLSVKTIMGYNELNNKDFKSFPKNSRPPTDLQASTSSFGNSQYKGWNLEPQIEYKKDIWLGKLNILIGGTLQEKIQSGNSLSLSGFASDALLKSAEAGSTVTSKSSTNIQYRYQAIFGRINYNIQNKYLLNITGRRDGSSRFGTGQQYANFGAIGAGWIFSKEKLIEDILPFLSFGKLRGSFGITGNDQIGDYQYLDAWGSKSGADGTYQNTSALFPLNLLNPVYGWEENKKLEFAAEFGLFKDRLFVGVDYFRNRSGNQLVAYRLPYMTGFGSITSNLPALVENKGWEIQVNADIISTKIFKWNSSFNITIPKNTLLAFPNLTTSTYASRYVIGASLNSIYNYQSIGVDQSTGLYIFKDINNDGALSAKDYLINGNTDPKFYGGFKNTFNFKGWEVDVFLDFKRQKGRNYLYYLSQGGINKFPGSTNNQPVNVLNRWQNSGDITTIEKFNTVANGTRANLQNSDAVYSDQSFIRLRSAQLSYNLTPHILSVIKAQSVNLYFQGQNLFTWNKDKGYNPETQALYLLAPLRNYTIGIRITY